MRHDYREEVRAVITHAIIPAGGRASRTGPLAAQISKALISIGNQPHLVRQINLLRKSGVDGDIVVVVNRDTITQVQGVLERCGLVDGITLVIQKEPLGVIQAILLGLDVLPDDESSQTVLLMSDTYLKEEIPVRKGEWIGVGMAESDRKFCFFDGSKWIDDECEALTSVYIGAAKLDTMKLYKAASEVFSSDHEQGSSVFLNAYGNTDTYMFDTWHDTGDVMALIRARKAAFISRGTHHLSLSGSTITKFGEGADFTAQLHKVETLCSTVPDLMPALYDITSTSYTMDYVEVPSLAELWLYWPGGVPVWTDILQYVIHTLEHSPLWKPWPRRGEALEHEFYVEKPLKRLNGRRAELREKLFQCMTRGLFYGSPTVTGHGDLNFGNVFFSMNSGAVKLIDPRGCDVVPLSYELGKLAYSFDGGLCAITHGLDPIAVHATHADEAEAMRRIIVNHPSIGSDQRLAAIQASMMLSSMPLHSPAEQKHMVFAAEELFNVALS
jgi:hypothetical protein